MRDWISQYGILVLLNTPYSFEYNLNLVSVGNVKEKIIWNGLVLIGASSRKYIITKILTEGVQCSRKCSIFEYFQQWWFFMTLNKKWTRITCFTNCIKLHKASHIFLLALSTECVHNMSWMCFLKILSDFKKID